jgi:hypothetical protein
MVLYNPRWAVQSSWVPCHSTLVLFLFLPGAVHPPGAVHAPGAVHPRCAVFSSVYKSTAGVAFWGFPCLSHIFLLYLFGSSFFSLWGAEQRGGGWPFEPKRRVLFPLLSGNPAILGFPLPFFRVAPAIFRVAAAIFRVAPAIFRVAPAIFRVATAFLGLPLPFLGLPLPFFGLLLPFLRFPLLFLGLACCPCPPNHCQAQKEVG